VNVIQPLIELQDTDGQIRELEREARDIPQRKAQETARLAGVNAALEFAKNHLEAHRSTIRKEEAEAEEIRAKVQALKLAQTSIKSNKEMQQSIMQIEGLERDAEAAENRALALEEDEIPGLKKRVEDALRRAMDEGVADAAGCVNRMTGEVAAFVKEAPQADDLTMLAIRYIKDKTLL
jgi:predicted  nucleic acid-binding Zn-ribbon protein